MSTAKRRVEKLERGLTPKQAVLMWLQEAHAFNGIEEYVHHLKGRPEGAYPIDKLTSQVEAGVRQTLKGKPREEIDKAVRQAYKDVLFLFYLHQQVNAKVLSEYRYYWTRWLLLSKELKSLLREQAFDRQKRWNRIRVELEMPYPLDSETAAAVDEARRNYVLPWDALEEGDDLRQWLMGSLLASGEIALPDGAYGLISKYDHLYSNVPTKAKVKELFQDEESFQKFLDEDDYSYGLADVPDAEYDEHYEAIVEAMKRVIQPGTVVDLPTVPHQFLKEAPLVDGDWIDRYTVELAEWGARMMEKGFLLEESKDSHPMAWHRIIDPADESAANAAVTMKLWQRTMKHLAAFPGRTSVIDERPYLSFEDYAKWRGRRNKGDIKPGMGTGMVVGRWNQWVEGQGGEGVAAIAEVKVGKLSCYLDGYRYRVCRTAQELTEEESQRTSVLESLRVRKPGIDDESFRHRVEQWKDLALSVMLEVFTVRNAVDLINKRYFDGQQSLFPTVAEGFDQLLDLAEKLVGIYNEALAEDIERLERLLIETGDGQGKSPPTISLAGLIENVQGAAREQIAYLVDTTKADALDLLGEIRQALELVDRHV